MKRVIVLLILAFTGCVNVKPVGVDKALARPEDPIKAVAAGVKVAVLAATYEPEMEVDGSGGDAPLKDTAPPPPVDPNPRTKVTYSPRYKEAYPTLTHMQTAVPAALKELGFDAVMVQSPQEAQAVKATWLLQLHEPEIEGFRRAQGGGVRLEGTVYDFHVTYRGLLARVGGQPSGMMTGHGEAKTNFWFDDKYLEAAIVGAVSLGVMALVTGVVAIPTAFFLVRQYRERGLGSPPVGDCKNAPSSGFGNTEGVCPQTVWMATGVAAISLLAIVASVTLGFGTFVGSQIFTAVTSGIKGAASGPIWEGMVKDAHDRAARSLAAQVARTTAPAVGTQGGRP